MRYERAGERRLSIVTFGVSSSCAFSSLYMI